MPRVAQRNCAIEYRRARFRIDRVSNKIAVTFELKALTGARIFERRLELCGDHVLRGRIEILDIVVLTSICRSSVRQ